MAQQELEISIDKTGKVTLHIKGIKGKRCMDIAHALAQVVGKITDTKYTSEYYEPDDKVALDSHLQNRNK